MHVLVVRRQRSKEIEQLPGRLRAGGVVRHHTPRLGEEEMASYPLDVDTLDPWRGRDHAWLVSAGRPAFQVSV